MDALPLYRQAALLSRFGGNLSRNTLAASIVRVGESIWPVINLLKDYLLQAPVLHADETTIQVLDEPGKKAQSKRYLWAQVIGGEHPIRLFGYSQSRSTRAAEQHFAGLSTGGALMSDGYEVYPRIANAHERVHLGCWAHCRRYFIEAEAALPKAQRGPTAIASQFVAKIGALYAVEAKARDLEDTARQQYRAQHSRPLLDELQTLLIEQQHRVLPGSLLGKALHYLAAQWPKLTRYVDNGAWPIDNNLCENAIRPFVVGRRNWLLPNPSPGRMPAPIFIRSLKPARRTELILIVIS